MEIVTLAIKEMADNFPALLSLCHSHLARIRMLESLSRGDQERALFEATARLETDSSLLEKALSAIALRCAAARRAVVVMNASDLRRLDIRMRNALAPLEAKLNELQHHIWRASEDFSEAQDRLFELTVERDWRPELRALASSAIERARMRMNGDGTR